MGPPCSHRSRPTASRLPAGRIKRALVGQWTRGQRRVGRRASCSREPSGFYHRSPAHVLASLPGPRQNAPAPACSSTVSSAGVPVPAGDGGQARGGAVCYHSAPEPPSTRTPFKAQSLSTSAMSHMHGQAHHRHPKTGICSRRRRRSLLRHSLLECSAYGRLLSRPEAGAQHAAQPVKQPPLPAALTPVLSGAPPWDPLASGTTSTHRPRPQRVAALPRQLRIRPRGLVHAPPIFGHGSRQPCRATDALGLFPVEAADEITAAEHGVITAA